ncbi:type IV toxin-antitoxin system AbiEi family antitoxin domain-containing protein [Streptomyces sp. NPDC060011]|uniref:type IV toxin-antitoxin system AbiEi family antitoxin domain-containing protein n=1 Tax=Streptomyces sp. NPDC060011 TaxID=3347037 RepID=UPI00367A878D
MDRAEQLATLSGAAADQWGLVTAAQAKILGLNAVQLLRLTEAGLLESVGRGVYLLAAGGMPQYLDIKVAWLRLQPSQFTWERPLDGPDSGVVSHASACQLHELGDIPAPQVDISVPRRRTTTEPGVRLRTALMDPADITLVDGLPVTTASRTIVDLLQAKADGGHIGGVIAEAERRDLIDVDELAERAAPFARKYGLQATATGRELIDHLVAQAGEHLRRQEVDRANQEGFEAAVNMLADRPDLAELLLRKSPPRPMTIKEALEANPAAQPATLKSAGALSSSSFTTLAALQKKLREQQPSAAHEALRQAMENVALPNPAMTAAIRKLLQPNDALKRAMKGASLHPDPALVRLLQLLQPDPAMVQAIEEARRLAPGVRRALDQSARTGQAVQKAGLRGSSDRQRLLHRAAKAKKSTKASRDVGEQPELPVDPAE